MLTFLGALGGRGVDPRQRVSVRSRSCAPVRRTTRRRRRSRRSGRCADPIRSSERSSRLPCCQVPPGTSRPRSTGPRCDHTQVRGAQAAYQGRSVSTLRDALFAPGTQMPYLASYIPQSLADWPNWDGAGHDLLLLGMYSTGHRSYLVGLDPDSDRVVGTVAVAPSHLGGMKAFFGPWLFAGDNPWPHPGSPTVERYRIDDLRAAMLTAVATRRQALSGRRRVAAARRRDRLHDGRRGLHVHRQPRKPDPRPDVPLHPRRGRPTAPGRGSLVGPAARPGPDRHPGRLRLLHGQRNRSR